MPDEATIQHLTGDKAKAIMQALGIEAPHQCPEHEALNLKAERLKSTILIARDIYKDMLRSSKTETLLMKDPAGPREVYAALVGAAFERAEAFTDETQRRMDVLLAEHKAIHEKHAAEKLEKEGN